MSKKQITIAVLVTVLLIGGMYLLFGGGAKYNWWEHYRSDSKDPYGTYLLENLLKDYFPGEKFEAVEDSLNGVLKEGNYVFVGSFLWLDSVQMDALLRFVEAGNQAFIASNTLPVALLDSIAGAECLDFSDFEDSLYFAQAEFFFEDTMVTLNFEHPDLAMDSGFTCKFVYRHEASPYGWEYLPDDFFCEDQTTFAYLGFLDSNYVNFARASYGKGAFYLHTTPLVFTNFNLVSEQGLDYADRALSHLRPGTIYWDDRQGRMPSFSRNRRLSTDGPLKYILTQPPLAWAWYILLGMAVLYLVFRAKRRQRMIPVLEQNTNTSLEFIGTIGRLFFLQNNHKQLALQKMKLFLGFVRERYHLPTKELNPQFAKTLAARSEIPEEVIGKILTLHRNISSSGYVSENVLVDFHRLVEGFYGKCK